MAPRRRLIFIKATPGLPKPEEDLEMGETVFVKSTVSAAPSTGLKLKALILRCLGERGLVRAV
jgi:hypothetical protein